MVIAALMLTIVAALCSGYAEPIPMTGSYQGA
jgi:hypothetical protein